MSHQANRFLGIFFFAFSLIAIVSISGSAEIAPSDSGVDCSPDDRGVLVTPLSPEPYYPMLLANGSDAVLVSYSGSMISGLTGHSHFEQHQGAPCAWYKVAHPGHMNAGLTIQPIVESGYQIIVDHEVCEPEGYTQRFDSRHAILATRVHARGVVCEVESFLTDDQVLVEHYRIIEAPEKGAGMAFFFRGARTGSGALRPIHRVDVKLGKQTATRLPFTYQLSGIHGGGVMLTDLAGNKPYSVEPGFHFEHLKAGWTATKFLILKDLSDGKDYAERLRKVIAECEERGFAGIRRKHCERWSAYSRRSRVTLPDKRLQYLYDVSLYVIRAGQHRPTGAITCGMLPFHWGGGTCVPYDAAYAQQALLATNHVSEADGLIRYYEDQRSEAKKLAKEFGKDGAVYPGWTTCLGKNKGRSMKEYLHYKPFMASYIALSCYWQWCLDPSSEKAEYFAPLMKEILDLSVASFIDDEGAVAHMRPSIAGNESYVEVENDTFNGLVHARTLAAYAEIAQTIGGPKHKEYAALAQRLYKGVFENYRDGFLWPYRNAKYITSLQFDFYLLNLPEGIDGRSISTALELSKTPWGLDSVQPSERYRDWPWEGTKAAIALTHMGDHKTAFGLINSAGRFSSALGALPEKIRMDGYPIGYWYTTCHALFAWSVTTALCHDGPEDEIRILWGMDGTWKDVAFTNLRLKGGILASGEVKDGILCKLTFRNPGTEPQQRTIRLNKQYGNIKKSELVLPAGELCELKLGRELKRGN
ncbi:MAG: hypothetical protein U9N87_04820 [Planctomycetota bacterium]|nr:hypothetical protein [Planctomycetota bacterium]